MSSLTSHHWNTLQAVMNRVIPADDYPNAWDAGVGDYLERQFGWDLADFEAQYAAAMEAFDEAARLAHQVAFADLSEADQDALLAERERQPFFRVLVAHVMEGYYADPGNGGNRGARSWDMIGFNVPGREGADGEL